jgi:glycosyltransferase involved in cell wall biosynthesis
MTKISLIVPCYNAEFFLDATIQSILEQEFSLWELILVDDGSHDATWEIISRYVRLDSRIVGFQKNNEGTAKTRNFGFSKANPSSVYIFFLDHDDQLEPSALARMSAYLDLHPDVGLLGCQFQDISADGQKLGTGKRSRWAPGRMLTISPPHELRDDEFETPFATFFCATGQGPFAMFRRSVLHQTALYDESFWSHEDSDIFCKMSLCAEVHSLAHRLYIKREHANNLTKVGRSNYSEFRQKWDWYDLAHPEFAATILAARRYYYQRHRPLRDFKVAFKTAKPIKKHKLKGTE